MILMDEDFGYDDVIGNQTVELDDLQIDEEKNMEIKFGEVNLKSTKVTKHTMELFLL